MIRKSLSTSLFKFPFLLAGMFAAGTSAYGQAGSQPAPTADNPLDLPETVTLLGQADPNLRTATAVVNGQVITGTDINQRLALWRSANRNVTDPEELKRVRARVFRNLIDETLQIQQARAQEIEVSQADINATYNRVAAQNFGENADAMDEYLTSVGSSAASLKRQIEGELSWQRLLRRNVQPFVNVSEEEVNEVIRRLEESRGTEEYRLGEIFLSSTPESAAAVEQNAKLIVEQLRQGGSFVAYARQFSEATTAAVGGDLDWIRLPQLRSPQLESIVREMQPGQLVGPVAIPGGYWIVYLIDKRQVLTADPRDAILSLKQLQIGFEPGISEAEFLAKVETFQQGIAAIRGCGEADAAAAAMGATVVTNDQMRVRALPEPLQAPLLQLQVGQSTQPFGSIQDGIRVLMLCGRDDPESAEGPSFEQMMAQIEDERVGKRAQRYLRDLRNDAYIEYN